MIPGCCWSKEVATNRFVRRLSATLCLWLVLLSSACGPRGTAARTGAHGESLSPSQASTIESLPVPHDARLEGSFNTSAGREADYMVSGVTLAEVDRWYEGQLPPGSSWMLWSPCKPASASGGVISNLHINSFGTQRSWYTPDGTFLFLGTQNAISSAVRIRILKSRLYQRGSIC
jgi:hypothetical protein